MWKVLEMHLSYVKLYLKLAKITISCDFDKNICLFNRIHFSLIYLKVFQKKYIRSSIWYKFLIYDILLRNAIIVVNITVDDKYRLCKYLCDIDFSRN